MTDDQNAPAHPINRENNAGILTYRKVLSLINNISNQQHIPITPLEYHIAVTKHRPISSVVWYSLPTITVSTQSSSQTRITKHSESWHLCKWGFQANLPKLEKYRCTIYNMKWKVGMLNCSKILKQLPEKDIELSWGGPFPGQCNVISIVLIRIPGKLLTSARVVRPISLLPILSKMLKAILPKT